MNERLLTIPEAAERLSISRAQFYRLGIRRVRIGRSVRIDPREIDRFIETHTDQPAKRTA
jgi:excisionase family DNA binding protein